MDKCTYKIDLFIDLKSPCGAKVMTFIDRNDKNKIKNELFSVFTFCMRICVFAWIVERFRKPLLSLNKRKITF